MLVVVHLAIWAVWLLGGLIVWRFGALVIGCIDLMCQTNHTNHTNHTNQSSTEYCADFDQNKHII